MSHIGPSPDAARLRLLNQVAAELQLAATYLAWACDPICTRAVAQQSIVRRAVGHLAQAQQHLQRAHQSVNTPELQRRVESYLQQVDTATEDAAQWIRARDEPAHDS